eukprot:scaffold190118_cov25-Tisochrysis_lutea.AAC.1
MGEGDLQTIPERNKKMCKANCCTKFFVSLPRIVSFGQPISALDSSLGFSDIAASCNAKYDTLECALAHP